MLVSAGHAYVLTFSTNVVTDVTASITTASSGIPAECGFSDGYFIARVSGSAKFQLSNSLDGLTWSGLDVAQISVFADNIVGMKVDHREIILYGRKQSVAYYDSGNTFAYDVIPGGFMEQG
jgi:hypothetical protein